MPVKNLDKYCRRLLLTFVVSNRKWHFNEFHDRYNRPKTPLNFSKPTLAKHLKHLEELKLITSKKEGKQRKSYQANWEKLSYLRKTVESQDALRRITENQKSFSSWPMEEQVIFLTNVLSLRDLEELKLQIIDIMEPNKNFEHNIQYAFTHGFFDLFKTWFVENCYKTTNENKLIALKTVENNIKHFEEDLFTRTPWKSQNK